MRFFFTILFMLFFAVGWGQKFSLRSTTQKVKVGEPLKIEAKLIFNKSLGQPNWPEIENGKLLQNKFELIDVQKINKKVNRNTEIWQQEFSIVMWDTGQYQMPPLSISIGGDEIFSDALYFEVISSQINTDRNPNDIVAIKAANWTFWDKLWFYFTKYFWFILIPVLVYLAYRIWKKRNSNSTVLESKENYTPWEWANKRILEMQKNTAWQEMDTREYYFQLSDIFKEYLEDHLSIRALDRTSSQIKLKCRKEPWYDKIEPEFKRFLREADLAKFAKAKTSPEEARKSLDFVKKMTELTRYNS